MKTFTNGSIAIHIDETGSIIVTESGDQIMAYNFNSNKYREIVATFETNTFAKATKMLYVNKLINIGR